MIKVHMKFEEGTKLTARYVEVSHECVDKGGPILGAIYVKKSYLHNGERPWPERMVVTLEEES